MINTQHTHVYKFKTFCYTVVCGMFLFGIITWSCSLSLIKKHDHQPQNFRGSFCLFITLDLLLFIIKSIQYFNTHKFIIIILHVSTMQSIDTPSLLILTIKHNITMYWLPIELGVILSIMCTMFSVCNNCHGKFPHSTEVHECIKG